MNCPYNTTPTTRNGNMCNRPDNMTRNGNMCNCPYNTIHHHRKGGEAWN
jgi:hypothetical protein